MDSTPNTFSTQAWLTPKFTVFGSHSGVLAFDNSVLSFTDKRGRVRFSALVGEIKIVDFRYPGWLWVKTATGSEYKITFSIPGSRGVGTRALVSQKEWQQILQPYVQQIGVAGKFYITRYLIVTFIVVTLVVSSAIGLLVWLHPIPATTGYGGK